MPTMHTSGCPGQRMTAQRKLLLELIDNAKGHLDADDLFRRAKEKDPRISLSTVYRNLQLFKEAGLVRERHFYEDHHHYELKDSAEHYHLICQRCNKVVEIQSAMGDMIKTVVGEDNQFDITDIEVNMMGYCPDCRE